MSHKMQTQSISQSNTEQFIPNDHKPPNDFFYSYSAEAEDQADVAEEEMRFPALPDLIEVEDLRDEVDGDQIYVQQLVAEYGSIQFND